MFYGGPKYYKDYVTEAIKGYIDFLKCNPQTYLTVMYVCAHTCMRWCWEICKDSCNLKKVFLSWLSSTCWTSETSPWTLSAESVWQCISLYRASAHSNETVLTKLKKLWIIIIIIIIIFTKFISLEVIQHCNRPMTAWYTKKKSCCVQQYRAK